MPPGFFHSTADKKIHIIATILLIFFTVNISPAASGENSIPPVHDTVQYHFGYWNDNFPVDNVFGKSMNHGRDDNVTAAFLAQAGMDIHGTYFSLDFFDSIITNKTREYRTDIAIMRLLMRQKQSWGSYSVGIGIVGNDNFGGETIQNSYHSLTGIKKLDLPYLGYSKTGLLLFTGIKKNLVIEPTYGLDLTASHSYRNEVLPNYYKAGLELSVFREKLPHHGISAFRLYSGYLEYYSMKRYFRSMFDNGFTAGAIVSYIIFSKVQLSVFSTTNQYGLEQPHFGFLMEWNCDNKRSIALSDISFP